MSGLIDIQVGIFQIVHHADYKVSLYS